MTLITGLFMGFINSFLELRIVRSSPFLTNLFKANTVWGMAFSLFLAIVIGTWIFAANGVVIMISWMVSTVVTQSTYEAQSIPEKRPMLYQQVQAWKSIFRFILFPFAILRWIFRLPYTIQSKMS